MEERFQMLRSLIDEVERAHDALERDTGAPDATLAALAAAYRTYVDPSQRDAIARIVGLKYPSLSDYLSGDASARKAAMRDALHASLEGPDA